MLVLGIDPGSRTAGYGLVEEKNSRLKAVGFGVVKPPLEGELHDRLEYLFRAFNEILEKYRPDEVAVEDVFFAENARSALMLGQARAAAMLPALLAGLPSRVYTALQVKKALVGNGHAQKKQVADMSCRILGLRSAPKPLDVTDALAVAICHIHSSPVIGKMRGK